MKFEKYNPVDEKGSCVIRTFSKLFDKAFYKMKEELQIFVNNNGYSSYNDIEAFEDYLLKKGYKKIQMKEELIKKLDLKYSKSAIFCHRDDFYHMISVINGVIYDKDDRCLDLYAISIYYLD